MANEKSFIPVLIVDDERQIRELWAKNLADISDDIRVASNLEDAFKLMRDIPHPDLVMLDLRLPGSTWQNTLSHIEKLKSINPRAIVFVCTGATDEEIPEIAKQLGADGFARKIDVASQVNLLKAVEGTIRDRDQKIPAFEHTTALLERIGGLMTRLSKKIVN